MWYSPQLLALILLYFKYVRQNKVVFRPFIRENALPKKLMQGFVIITRIWQMKHYSVSVKNCWLISKILSENLLITKTDKSSGKVCRLFIHIEKYWSLYTDSRVSLFSTYGLSHLPPHVISTFQKAFSVNNLPSPFLPASYIQLVPVIFI